MLQIGYGFGFPAPKKPFFANGRVNPRHVAGFTAGAFTEAVLAHAAHHPAECIKRAPLLRSRCNCANALNALDEFCWAVSWVATAGLAST